MIKYILIIVMLAALVPTSLPNVSASTSTESLTIEGNGDEAEMLLVKEKGEQAKDVSLSTENVLAIEEDDDVTVQDNVEFTKALLTPSEFAGDPDKGIRVPITQDGVVDLDRFGTGVYSLFVVVDDNRAYEAIIVIGEQDEDTVNKTINKVNLFITIITEIIFEEPEPEPPSVCYFDPNDPACDPDESGDCPPGFGHNEDDRCIPVGKCPPGYVRADDDETGTCFEKGKDERIKECPDGSIRLIGDTCYYETPIPDGCEPGYELRDGICYEIPPLPEEPTPTPEPSQCKPCNAGPGEMCPDVCLPPDEMIIIPNEDEEIIDEEEPQDSTDEELQDQEQDQEQDDEPSDDDEIEMDEEGESAESE